MEFKLKPITESSWILHNSGVRLAVITASSTGFRALGKLETKEFSSIAELSKILGGNVTFEEVEQEVDDEASTVDGYPIKHSAAYDIITDTYSSYAKVAGSASRYAAGYYGVLFAHGWVYSYCPKTSTLDENTWIGPFRTKLEMQNSITQQKNAPRI